MSRSLGLGLVGAVWFLVAGVGHPSERPSADSGTIPSPEVKAALLEAREQVWRAWFTNDRAKLEELLPAETLGGSRGRPGWDDRAKILAEAEAFAKSSAKLVDLQFPATQIQCYGDVAIVYTTYRFETETNSKRRVATGKATEIFVKRDGRWLNPGWLMVEDK